MARRTLSPNAGMAKSKAAGRPAAVHRAMGSSFTNDVISSSKRRKANSSSKIRWLRLSSGTNRAPGMAAAIRRPDSKGTLASWRECITNVGTLTLGRSAVTSVSPVATRLRAASSDDVEILCNSLNQSACSFVPAGVAKRWIFLAPPQTHQGEHCFAGLLLSLCSGPLLPAYRVAAKRTRRETRSGCRIA